MTSYKEGDRIYESNRSIEDGTDWKKKKKE